MSGTEDFLIIHNFADFLAYLVQTHYRAPKVCRRADIIAVLKPNKSADDPKNYRPISMLCVPLKLLERLLLSILDPMMLFIYRYFCIPVFIFKFFIILFIIIIIILLFIMIFCCEFV